MAEWQTWRNKGDETIEYEAREVEGGYMFREPGQDSIEASFVSKGFWEMVYERERANDE